MVTGLPSPPPAGRPSRRCCLASGSSCSPWPSRAPSPSCSSGLRSAEAAFLLPVCRGPTEAFTSETPACTLGVSHRLLSQTQSWLRPLFLPICRLQHPVSPQAGAILGCLGSSPVACCSSARQACLTLATPRDCSSPGSSVHGILPAGILEWVAVFFSRRSSQLRG